MTLQGTPESVGPAARPSGRNAVVKQPRSESLRNALVLEGV